MLNQQVGVRDSRNGVQRNVYDPERLRAGLEENGEFSRFVFHQGEVLTEEAGDLALKTRFVRGYGVEACQQNGQMYYYQKDEQFSTLLVSDAGQGVENFYRYDAFGVVRESQEKVQNRITYTGQQYDGVTEQYYLRARYYNPVLGRFLQEDEYRGDGLNLYAYCGNNPVGYFDPSGYKQDANDSCKSKRKQIDGDGKGPVVEEIKTTGGQKTGGKTLPEGVVQRGVTPEQALMIMEGAGIEKAKPAHKTTATQHVGGTKHSRDPWTSMTKSSDTAEYYATHTKGNALLETPNPIIEVDLSKINSNNVLDVSNKTNAEKHLTTPFTQFAAAADKEVLIYGDIPYEAITKIIWPKY